MKNSVTKLISSAALTAMVLFAIVFSMACEPATTDNASPQNSPSPAVSPSPSNTPAGNASPVVSPSPAASPSPSAKTKSAK